MCTIAGLRGGPGEGGVWGEGKGGVRVLPAGWRHGTLPAACPLS